MKPACRERTARTISTDDYSLRSWLLTHRPQAHRDPLLRHRDHAFFFIGGAAATLMRLELATPQGDLVTAETYNRLFTMHGVIMVWFFLIPSIPAVLGNFLVPLMIGARDLAFPRLNLTELVSVHARRRWSRSAPCSPAASTPAGPSTRRSRALYSNSYVIVDGDRHVHRRLLVDPDRAELHRHHPHAARAGHDLVPAAAVHLVDLCDERDPGAGDAGAGDDAAAAGAGADAAASASSIRRWAAIRCCSSTCSGSTRTRPCTS